MKRNQSPETAEPKRLEQPWVSTYGLLVALGMPIGELAPLRADVLPVLDHECSRAAGVDVPRDQPIATTQEDAP
jgi:hypothetical protein